MIKRMLESRGFPAIAVALVIAIVIVATVLGLGLLRATPTMRSYCALMPDSIGLYKGSSVTVMGMKIGQVTAVKPNGPSARVEFDIRADRRLPVDVGATTLSNTLIADRNLALVGDQAASGGWDATQCITNTVTPRSLTQTFTALAHLADQLNGADDPAHPDLIEGGLHAIDTATSGTGDEINRIVHGLGAALNSPDAAIGHIGALLDALAALTHSANRGWSQVEPMVVRLAEALDDINTIAAPPIIGTLNELRDVLPEVDDLAAKFGSPLLQKLDSIPDLPQQISSGIGSLRQIIDMVPAIAGAFSTAVDPATHRVSVAYASPRVAIAEPDAAQICSALRTMRQDVCSDPSDGLVKVPLAQLLLSMPGGR